MNKAFLITAIILILGVIAFFLVRGYDIDDAGAEVTEIETQNLPQIAATLSAIAYMESDGSEGQQYTAMSTALQNTSLPTSNEWEIIWGPVTVEEDLSFIAKGPANSLRSFQYAYVVRGTIFDWDNLVQDAKDTAGLNDIPWPNASCSGGKISDGTLEGYTNLSGATQTATVPAQGTGKTALQVLENIGSGSEILVTGHSLGAQLASSSAMWIEDQVGTNASVKAYTFAAPTAGNQAFATCNETQLGSDGRIYNGLDVVPKLWNHSDLEAIYNLYPGSDSPSCDHLNGCDEAVDAAIVWVGHQFFQPSGGTLVNTTGCQYNEGDRLLAFKDEVEAQHSSLFYMWLLDVPLAPIQSLFPQNNWNPPAGCSQTPS